MNCVAQPTFMTASIFLILRLGSGTYTMANVLSSDGIVGYQLFLCGTELPHDSDPDIVRSGMGFHRSVILKEEVELDPEWREPIYDGIETVSLGTVLEYQLSESVRVADRESNGSESTSMSSLEYPSSSSSSSSSSSCPRSRFILPS